jgi:hypothetical protein
VKLLQIVWGYKMKILQIIWGHVWKYYKLYGKLNMGIQREILQITWASKYGDTK